MTSPIVDTHDSEHLVERAAEKSVPLRYRDVKDFHVGFTSMIDRFVQHDKKDLCREGYVEGFGTLLSRKPSVAVDFDLERVETLTEFSENQTVIPTSDGRLVWAKGAATEAQLTELTEAVAMVGSVAESPVQEKAIQKNTREHGDAGMTTMTTAIRGLIRRRSQQALLWQLSAVNESLQTMNSAHAWIVARHLETHTYIMARVVRFDMVPGTDKAASVQPIVLTMNGEEGLLPTGTVIEPEDWLIFESIDH